MQQLYCIAKFQAKEGYKEQLLKGLLLLSESAHKEAGCVQYDLTEEIEFSDAGNEDWDFCFHEIWRSQADFDIHCEMSYINQFFDIEVPKYVEKFDIRVYSPIG